MTWKFSEPLRKIWSTLIVPKHSFSEVSFGTIKISGAKTNKTKTKTNMVQLVGAILCTVKGIASNQKLHLGDYCSYLSNTIRFGLVVATSAAILQTINGVTLSIFHNRIYDQCFYLLKGGIFFHQPFTSLTTTAK